MVGLFGLFCTTLPLFFSFREKDHSQPQEEEKKEGSESEQSEDQKDKKDEDF